MIIDFHAHIYPEKIAEKATAAISTFYEDAPMAWHGHTEELLKSGREIGVTKYIVHSTATKAAQVESINNFIIGECAKYPEFVGFGTMHYEYENCAAELARIRAAGLRGIKFHPDFQKFQADMPEMDPIYDEIAKHRLPVLFHAGDYRYDYSGPARIAHVKEKHPDLIVIAAHFGGYTEWDEAINHLVGKDVYFDTSSSFWKLPADKARMMIEKHGYEKFLFGSDFPMWDHAGELKRLKALQLPAEWEQAILFGNGDKLLKSIE